VVQFGQFTLERTVLVKFYSVALCLLLLGLPAHAEEQVVAPINATTDVEATMKDMGFSFKQAEKAETVAEMQQAITALQQQVASVQSYQFPKEKHAIFQQGLTEVQAQLDIIAAHLAQGDLAQAKQQLAPIMTLKKRYHKERSPSFWQLLFGE
jgi:soluble cytochrome b562